MSARLGGLEDVPPGVAAVLTAAPVDLLSHIAIRCRQSGVLLAAMTDSGGWAELMALSGTQVRARCTTWIQFTHHE
jgi:alpha-glucan,water dikinase